MKLCHGTYNAVVRLIEIFYDLIEQRFNVLHDYL